MTQQNRRAVPSSLFGPCQRGGARYELHGPQGVRIKSPENARPSRQQLQPRKTVFFLCTTLRMLLPAYPRQHRGQLEKHQWRLKPLQDNIISQNSYHKCKLLQDPFIIAEKFLEGVFVGAGEMAQGQRTHAALSQDQSSVPRTLLDSSQLPVTGAPGRSQGLWLCTSTHKDMIKAIIKMH